MTIRALPRRRRRPVPPPLDDDPSGIACDHAIAGLRGGQTPDLPAGDMLAQGLIEFLDKRWTRAEADPRSARRSMLLVFCLATGIAMVILSLALAAAGFIAVILLAQEMVGTGAATPVTALLAATGASLLALAVRRRAIGR